jgi:predicted DNA-binding protein with PD1-like motif
MKSQLMNDHAGLRTFVVVFETGHEAVEGLKRFAREHRVTGAQLTAIGAFSQAVVGYFDWAQKDYRRIAVNEQVEVLTLAGNIGVKRAAAAGGGQEDEPALHAHVVLGRADGSACGGHLLEAMVRPTLEVVVLETPRHLQRRFNPETGLPLIDLSA